MRPTLVLILSLLAWASPMTGAGLPVLTRNNQAFVTAATLEAEAGMVIKRLPGRDGRPAFVACGRETCARVDGVTQDGGALLVPVTALAEAMNLEATFDADARRVTFAPAPRKPDRPGETARVGTLAPNLRLTRLDGTAITLDELRGQRVLINSWASW